MAIEVLPANNTFTGTAADEFANSTSATETFTMGGGTNTINFDLSGNKLLGADEIYLTPGENLVLNFTSQINFGSFMDYNELITWERVQNNDGTIDIAIKTKPFCTLGYMQRKTATTIEVDHTDYYGNPYFKAVVTESLYDYELDKWVEINSWNTYSKYDNEIYGLRALNSKGEIQDSWYGDTTSTDMHEDVEVEKRIGEVTTIIDYKAEPINTILIKNIGAKTANSVKLQYTNPDNTAKTYQEYINGSYQDVDFITKNYAIGTKDSTENQVLQGSFLDETFNAGYGDDTINTVGGTNKVVLANGGNDVITLGTGADLINAEFGGGYKCDLNTNNVTEGIYIKNGNSADTLELYQSGQNNFYRDENNLVIIQNWQYNVDSGSGARARNSKFTIEDYFTAESKIVIKSGHIYEYYGDVYNYEHYFTLSGAGTNSDPYKITETYTENNTPKVLEHELGNIIQSSGSAVNGTDNSETIVAEGLATITTGAGDDTIYTSEGNDTITINGAGDKHIIIDENSGDDTIIIQNHEGNIYLDLINYSGADLYKSKVVTNDLIIERYRNEYTSNGNITKFKGRTIIKDYLAFSDAEKAKIFVKRPYNWGGNEYNQLSVSTLNIEGDEGETNIIYGSDLNDNIIGKELADTIYTGKGADSITPNQGDDLIEINDNGSKTINIARTDGNDTIRLSGDGLGPYPPYNSTSYMRLRYTDGFTGLSHQIQDGNLVVYTTTADGDNITTQNTTITGITGGEVTTENIADYNYGGLNVSGRINIYNGSSSDSFRANTPWHIKGSETEANNITATSATTNYTSNLIIGGSADDIITAAGEINHVYTSAGNDTIDVTSSVQAVVYAGSGNNAVTVNGGENDYVYAMDGNDVINLTSGSATIYSEAGDDTINISGGSATIYTGSGADTINITGGTGGNLNFTVGDGNKIVNFQNASDAQYHVSFTGSYDRRYFYKDGNDLRIETKYNNNYETGEYDTENYYLNNFFDPNHSKVNPDTTKMGGYYSPLRYTDLNIIGEDDPNSNGKIFRGTYCEDIISGTDYADTIITGINHDEITPGKGDDMITITGDGQKSFILSKGDGNDTIHINEDVVFSGYANDRDPGIHLYNKDSYDSNVEQPDNYSYSIDNGALTIYRIYKNGGNALTKSVKITGIRALDTDNPAPITAENIASSSGGLNVSDKIYIQGIGNFKVAMSRMNKGNENSVNNLNTIEGVKNTVVGGTKADTIISNGSDDYISAGAGNDIITTSAETATIYGGEGNDTITSTAATATIYGGEGNDTITSTATTATIYDDAGDDTVTVTGGTNNIYIGEGSDTIKIKGGQGTINLSAGSGDNTVIFESNNADGTCHLDGDYNIAMSGSGWSSSYTKSGEDLIVYRYSNATTDTVTIKGLFGDNQLANGNNLKINGWNLSSMHIEGNYDKKLKATVYSGSNYNDNIYGTDGNDIITTGGGNDTLYLNKGNDRVIIDGSGDKNIYYKQGGNKEIQLGAGVDLGEIRLSSGDSSHASSYKIVNNDFIWYRTYIDGDKFATESTRFTGITGGDVTYDNIMGYGDTQLNLTNKLKSRPYLQLTQGNFKKTNKITTKASTKNLVLGGKKKDTIVLNGLEDVVYSSAGADKITVNGEFGSDTVYAGSGNDTIILNANDKSVDIYGGKGNDKIYANGNSRYNIYGEKGDGNDTLILGKDFNQRLYFYNSGNSPTQQAHSIVNNNLLLYRIYVDGDTFTTNSVKVTGIKSRTDTPVEVNYNNIVNSSGGLNISGSYISDFNKNMIQGSASKANKLSTKEGTYNVVLGGKKNDTVTLNGSYDNAYTGAGADSITIKAGNTHVYAGSGNDTINVKGGSSHQIYTGKGNDTVNITGASGTINLIAGEGNDTFRFTGSEHGNYNLNISGYNNYYNRYYKSGNDLLVKNTYTNAKKKTVTESHTIKDYFKNDSLENKVRINNSYISDRLNSDRLNIVGKYNKSKKATLFEGTKYDDMIKGTKGKDIITTGAGYDQITPGKGDDTITINNSGTKNIYINNGDGNDIIQWTNPEEAAPIVIYLNDCDVISYKKSGSNLVITRTYESGKSLKSENTTIEGYYDAEGNVVESVANNLYLSNAGGLIAPEKSFNRVNYKTPNINVSNDYELAVATAKADTITTTAENAAIFALAGNDTITINGGNAFVTGGKGTDTINVNTTGLATICHLAGDGNDIVNFGENTPSGLKVNVDSSLFSSSRNANIDNYMYMSGKHGLIRSGNDLIYSIPTSSAFNTKAEKITFKDYFKDGVNKPAYITLNLSDYDYHLDSLESIASGNGIWVEGINNDGVTTYTGMDNYTNRYEYKGTGKTIINGANRADYYNVSLNSKSNLYINDSGNQSGWGYDTLYINTNYKNLRALFNMSASGQVIVSEDDQYSDNFMIFNKGSLTYDNVKKIFSGKDGKGVINIDHVFNETTYYSANGTGSIEYIYAGKDIQKQTYNSGLDNNKNVQRLYTSLWVEDLGEKVASWLSANTDGSKTSFEIFETGTKDEINALLKVYNTVYDKNFTT